MSNEKYQENYQAMSLFMGKEIRAKLWGVKSNTPGIEGRWGNLSRSGLSTIPRVFHRDSWLPRDSLQREKVDMRYKGGMCFESHLEFISTNIMFILPLGHVCLSSTW